MLFAINAWCNSAIDVVIASDFWEVMSTRLFFLKDRARVHIFFTKTIQQVGFQAILILTLLGCTQGRSNEAMWWSCPMALCGCTTSEAPDGSLMATKTSSKVSKSDRNMLQSYSKWYTVYYYIYIWIYHDISIYAYRILPFIPTDLHRRLGGGLDGLPNEGIQMQIGLKCPGTDVGLRWDAAWSSPSHSACVTATSQDGLNGRNLGKLATTWRTRGSRPTR